MYERLLEQADLEQERFAQERAAWQATEAALRQEAAELRNQLLYVLAQLNTLQQAGGNAAGPPLGPAPSARSFVGRQPAAIGTQQPAGALSSSASSASLDTGALGEPSLSPAEQVKAVVDAAKAGSASPPSQAPRAAEEVQPSAAWPEGEAEVPSYAADLAAAVAAVDNSDVLSGLGILEDRLQERRAAARSSSNGAPAPAQQPTAAAPPPPPPPSEPVAAPVPAEPAGPPPPLTLGSDDLFWVNQARCRPSRAAQPLPGTRWDPAAPCSVARCLQPGLSLRSPATALACPAAAHGSGGSGLFPWGGGHR